MFLSGDFLKMNSNELVYACVLASVKVALPY